jgi:bacteriorhodopsin
MYPEQFFIMLPISLALLVLVIRLIHKGMLDISYCWLWLAVGIAAPLIVIKYNWLLWFSQLIKVSSPITTLFLFSILILFLMCLQFSIVIAIQRRQIKTLAQQIAILLADK